MPVSKPRGSFHGRAEVLSASGAIHPLVKEINRIAKADNGRRVFLYFFMAGGCFLVLRADSGVRMEMAVSIPVAES